MFLQDLAFFAAVSVKGDKDGELFAAVSKDDKLRHVSDMAPKKETSLPHTMHRTPHTAHRTATAQPQHSHSTATAQTQTPGGSPPGLRQRHTEREGYLPPKIIITSTEQSKPVKRGRHGAMGRECRDSAGTSGVQAIEHGSEAEWGWASWAENRRQAKVLSAVLWVVMVGGMWCGCAVAVLWLCCGCAVAVLRLCCVYDVSMMCLC